ncbi:hypothetical protein DPMN_059151 [Dreissena polymorpha]|uniref:Uncharacterized protein n=1 Tax=Dreissena polymorpha TaxID=45954 RepID=A0A9D4C3K3_DREPO|nr:hypothetical protein DPMN_059151 [Dreissena polymorpha]
MEDKQTSKRRVDASASSRITKAPIQIPRKVKSGRVAKAYKASPVHGKNENSVQGQNQIVSFATGRSRYFNEVESSIPLNINETKLPARPDNETPMPEPETSSLPEPALGVDVGGRGGQGRGRGSQRR